MSFASVMSSIGSYGTSISNAAGGVNSIWNAIGYNPIASYQSQHDFNKQADLQRELTQMQYRLSNENWENQFKIESEYNTPANQRARMEQAGFNPFVSQAADNGTINMPAQTGAGGASVNPVPNYQESYSRAALAGLQGIHQGLVNDRTKEMLNATLQNILADSANKDAETEYRQIMSDIEKSYGKMLRRKELNKLQAEIQEITARAVREESQGKYFDAAAFEADMRAAMEIALGKKYDSEKQLIDLDIKSYSRRIASLLRLQGAQATAASASAEESKASAKELGARAEKESEEAETIRQLRPEQKQGMQLENAIKKVQKAVQEKTGLDKALAEVANTQLVNRKLVQEIEKAYKENNVFYADFCVSVLSRLAAAWRDGAIAGNQSVNTIKDAIDMLPDDDPIKVAGFMK